MDELLVAVGLVFAVWLVCTGNSTAFGKCWAAYSLLVAVVAFIGFFVNIFRMVMWMPFGLIAGAISAIIDAVVLPIWIIWVGCALRGASAPGPTYMKSGTTLDRVVDPKPDGDVEMSAERA